MANALPAYDQGASGAGVKVAVVDTGINPNLPEFAGRVNAASQDVAANRGITDTNGHGTMVSAVIAANKDDVYMHGVAFGASILSLNVGDPAGCINGNNCFLDSAIDDAIDLARSSGARIINMSFGDEEGMTADVWPAIQRAVNAGMIIVMAAGNNPTANPNGFALQNIQNNGNSGLFIIAGAIDSNGNIANFSARAGTTNAANYYLMALGVGNATVNQTGAHVTPSGTSFSTPTIVGAAALLAGAFPNLSGSDIVNLLLTTADDAGAPGTDAIYGRGILNIGRAFQPQGKTLLAGTATAMALAGNGTSSGPIGDGLSRSHAHAIVLDAYKRAYEVNLGGTIDRSVVDHPLNEGLSATDLQSVTGGAGPVAFDLTVRRGAAGSLYTNLTPTSLAHADSQQARAVAGLVVSRLSARTKMAFGLSQSAHALQQRLSGQWGQAFLVAEDPVARAGYQSSGSASAAIREQFGPIGLTVATERGREWTPGLQHRLDRSDYYSVSTALDGRLGRIGYGLGLTQLDESEAILGSRLSSTIQSGGSRTSFVEGTVQFDLGRGWQAEGSYRRGWTTVAANGGLARRGRLSSEAFAGSIIKTGLLAAQDHLGFKLSQPLRVRSGGLGLYVPVEYDYATQTAVYGSQFMSLAPSGRELDYEVLYGFELFGGQINLNAFTRTDPGHIDSMKRDTGAAIRFKVGL